MVCSRVNLAVFTLPLKLRVLKETEITAVNIINRLNFVIEKLLFSVR
jgi:hypothetical protein